MRRIRFAVRCSANVARGTKRRLGNDQDKVLSDRNFKRQRRNGQANLIPNGKITTAPQLKEQSKRSRQDTVDDEPQPKRTRLDNRRRNAQHEGYGSVDGTSTQGTESKSKKVANSRPARSALVPPSPISPPSSNSPQSRHGSRIAVRQDPSRDTVPSPHAPDNSCRTPHRQVVQLPTPPSST